MSEAKFTPGPWVAEPSHASMDPVICMVAGLVISCKDIEHNKVANAHLIAAAPELYEALVRMKQWCEDEVGAELPCSSIDAALAKARGETL